MKIVYTMLEIIKQIKSTQETLDDLYRSYVTSPDSRSLVTLYNDTSKCTINGQKIEDAKNEITGIDTQIRIAFNKLHSFLMVKEVVNSTKTVKIINIDGKAVTRTPAQLLMLSSAKIKKYHLDYINKLERDYKDALLAQSAVTKQVMSDDKISMYVNARMNSLHIAEDPGKVNYVAFAKEYREANRMDLYDPLDIQNTILDMKKNVSEYYDRIANTLSIFNATTKVMIEFGDDFDMITWSFVDNSPVNNEESLEG